MAGIEVLAPLRIETRFVPPDALAGRFDWLLRLRVYPDEFSMERKPPSPTNDELDRLEEALAGPLRDPPIDEASAFSTFASAVGAARAVWLIRGIAITEVNGWPVADRSEVVERDPSKWPKTHLPAGLPPQLDVWLVPVAGAPYVGATLDVDRVGIAADLDLETFSDEEMLGAGDLPDVWWTSFERAKRVGLGVEINLGPAIPDLEAIVVLGLGDEDPQALLRAHAATGRLAVLAPGTPTNTVEGEPTTEMGRDPAAWLPLVSATPADQPAGTAVMRALSGEATAPPPLLGGDFDSTGPRAALIAALWPVLWGRAIRDVQGAANAEESIAQWATDMLAPEGPYPAIRVGEQPYGILPVTALARWVAEPSDPKAESRVLPWAIAWRDLAATDAESRGTVVGASTERLVELLGECTPSRRWGIRPIAPLAVARALRAAAGMPTIDATAWDVATAMALTGYPQPLATLAPVGWNVPLPGDPRDRYDKPDILEEVLRTEPRLLFEWNKPLGLLGHLLRESILLARAAVGQAFLAYNNGDPVDPDTALPLCPVASELTTLIVHGTDPNVVVLRNSGDPGAQEVAKRFIRMHKAAHEVIDRWVADDGRVFDALLAMLDTASHRVDPWAIGIADRRLRTLTEERVPFRVGAYGWVDRPQPYDLISVIAPALAPGPTEAGLLHAPSATQALTAALLRDAAVRNASDDRWKIEIDSSKVRAAMRLGERVRLGVHPYEALGLEVERLTGDWNAVRVLREGFPFRDTHEGRRTCDGARVLRAVLHGAETLPPGLPAGLAKTLRPLDDVLDTYADLLVTDGVHALVSGRGDLANAAMEAAAGLGAPPELRAMRTPRAATPVRVSAWALLDGVASTSAMSPVVAADPAFAKLVDDEIGAPFTWTWSVEAIGGPVSVSLDDRSLRGAELVGLAPDAVERLVRGPLLPASTAVRSTGGNEKLAAASRLAALLGGGDENPTVPDPASGRDDERAAASDLRDAMIDDLQLRYGALVARGLPASGTPPATVNGLRNAIRKLVGAPGLPVLPLVDRTRLPAFTAPPKDADGKTSLDRTWLEIVAAVRPRLAQLEALQLDAAREPWPAVISTKKGGIDPWTADGPVVVAYGPGTAPSASMVAVCALDAWTDAIPSAEHATSAVFGFNAPKSRAPQAILLAVPPDTSHRTTNEELFDILMETRLLVRARAARPDSDIGLRVATPSPVLSVSQPVNFLDGGSWP